MRMIRVRDKHGAPMLSAVDGRPATISISMPGTFQKLPEGPETLDHTWPRREVPRNSLEPTIEQLEELADYVCAWDGWVSQGAPRGIEMECSRSLVILLLKNSPSIRSQVERAVADLNRQHFQC